MLSKRQAGPRGSRVYASIHMKCLVQASRDRHRRTLGCWGRWTRHAPHWVLDFLLAWQRCSRITGNGYATRRLLQRVGSKVCTFHLFLERVDRAHCLLQTQAQTDLEALCVGDSVRTTEACPCLNSGEMDGKPNLEIPPYNFESVRVPDSAGRDRH